jgi:hypothetical protein
MAPKNAPAWNIDTTLDESEVESLAFRPKEVLKDGNSSVPPMKAES